MCKTMRTSEMSTTEFDPTSRNLFVTIPLVMLGAWLSWRAFSAGQSKQLPGPAGFPLVGLLFRVSQGRTHEQFLRLAERYG